MPRPKNQEAITEQRRAKVAELYTANMGPGAIAKELKCGRQTVWRDLQVWFARWRKEGLTDFAARQEAELAKLDLAEAEAWEQWERSKKNAREVITRNVEDGIETTNKTKGQCGDPQYLATILKCSERRAKILGLDAPTKIADTDKNGNDLTPDQHRARLIERLSRIMQPAGTGGVRQGHNGNGNGHASTNGNGRK